MDRLKSMRQRDWARVFGVLCAVVGLGLSVAGYPGADWDALILCLGALMLLRAAVEGPSPSRAAGLMRAGRVIVFMFAFASVNRAQGGVDGAVSGAVGNWILWAVAALLLVLPLVRKGLPWRGTERVGVELVLLIAFGLALWLAFRWLGDADMAALRALVAVAAVANARPIIRQPVAPMIGWLAFGLMLVCVVVVPGGALWPVALVILPVTLGFAWLQRKVKTPPRA
jgi:hypothetical protein